MLAEIFGGPTRLAGIEASPRPNGTVESAHLPGRRSVFSASGPANQWTPLSSRPCLPYVGDIANGRAPSLRGHCSASSLLRTQPPPSRLRPTSRFRRLYGLPCSDDFAPGRAGLLQLLSMSLSPCCRFRPAEVNIRVGQSSAAHAAFALQLKARPSEILIFEATTRSLLLRPGDS
jgi:hypothetical protein